MAKTRVAAAPAAPEALPTPALEPPPTAALQDTRGRGPAVNRVTLVGRLTTDPELRYGQAGTPYTNMRIATNDRDQPEFHEVVSFKASAEAAGKYLQRGSLVYVEGRLHTSRWEADDGTPHSRTEIQANSVQFLATRSAERG